MGYNTGSAYKKYMNVSSIVATTDMVEGELFRSVGIKVVVAWSEGSLKLPKEEAALNYQEKSSTVIPRSLRIASIIPSTVIADYCFFFRKYNENCHSTQALLPLWIVQTLHLITGRLIYTIVFLNYRELRPPLRNRGGNFLTCCS